MTSEGHAAMHTELAHLKSVERPRISKEIGVAREHGDLRENAEYHAAKDRQGELAGRMAYLESRISLAQVIDPESIESETIGFGAKVTLLDTDSEEKVVYFLVGEDETDVRTGKISIVAPIARALLGKGVGDEVTVKLPKGEHEYEVLAVEYKRIP